MLIQANMSTKTAKKAPTPSAAPKKVEEKKVEEVEAEEVAETAETEQPEETEEVEVEAEEETEETEEKPKKGKAAPKKGVPKKAGAKAAPKKGGSKKKSESSEAKEKQLNENIQTVVDADLIIALHEQLYKGTFQETLAKNLTHYALQRIDQYQHQEVAENFFPPGKFKQYSDTLSAGSGKKQSVKTKTSKTSTEEPSTGKIRKKSSKTEAKEVKSDDTETKTSEKTEEKVEEPAAEAEADESADKKDAEAKEEKKARNIISVSKGAKLYLAFMFDRFITDVVPEDKSKAEVISAAKKVRDEETFLNYVFKYCGNDDYASHVSKSMVVSVATYSHLVNEFSVHSTPFTSPIENYLKGETAEFNSLLKQMTKTMDVYLRLIGNHLAHCVWASHKTLSVSDHHIEEAVRHLDDMYMYYVTEHKLIPEDSPYYRLSEEFFTKAHSFIKIMAPKAPKKPATKKAGAKKKPAAKKSKTSKKAKEEPEEETEETEEAEEAEEAEEQQETEETEEVEETEEAEEAEEPAKEVKPVKKLSAKK